MGKRKRVFNFEENKMIRKIHKLAEFEEFSREILPSLRNDLKSGMDPEELLKKHQAIAAARLISIAAMEADSSKAAQAAKDILDRTMGKAKESKEIHHKLQDLSDKELDSLLTSELKALEEDTPEDSFDA